MQKVSTKIVYTGVFMSIHKNQKKLIKKCDISPRKFKKRGTLKMVSKRLKDHYLKSYEQF